MRNLLKRNKKEVKKSHNLSVFIRHEGADVDLKVIDRAVSKALKETNVKSISFKTGSATKIVGTDIWMVRVYIKDTVRVERAIVSELSKNEKVTMVMNENNKKTFSEITYFN